MRKFFKYSSILFIGIITILLIIPSFVSLDSYKSLITDKVKETTGRELKINGNITFALLPNPSIKIKVATLASLPNSHANSFLEVKEVSASISLFSLLTGEINIAAINIYEPIVNLERLPNGSASWEFSTKLPAEADINKNSSEGNKKSTDLASFYIDSIKLFKGKINYFDFSDNHTKDSNPSTTLEIDNLELKNLHGPANISGQLYSSGKEYNLEANIKEKNDIIVIQANLNAFKERIIIMGDLAREEMNFTGKFNLQGNIKNLENIFPQIKIRNDADHKLTFNIELNKELLEIRDINLSSGKISVTGDGKYHLGNNTVALKLQLDPGNMNITIKPIAKDKNIFHENIYISSDSLKPLFNELAIDTQNIPNDLLNKSFTFVTDFKYQDQNINLNDTNLNIEKDRVKGDLGFKNWNKNILVTYNFQVESLPTLTRLFAINPSVKLSNIILKGETTKEQDLLKTNNTLIFAKSTNNITGIVNLDKSIKPNLTIESIGENLGNVIKELTESSSNAPLGQYSLLAKLEGETEKFIKININKFTVGIKGSQSNLKGNIDINLKSAKPEIVSDITVTTLNLTDLSVSTSTPATQNDSTSQGTNNAIPWNKDKIDLSLLQKFEGNLTLNILKLIKEDLIFDNIKANISLSNGILNIKSLASKLYGGNLEATGQLSSHSNQAVSLKANLQSAELKNMIKQDGKIKVTKGTTNFVMDIKTSGPSQLQYLNNLLGTASLTVTRGAISGFNLQKTLNAFKTTKNLEDILRTLNMSFSGGETNFQNLIIDTEIQKGIANIVQGRLVADESTITATGNINLPSYSCDIDSIVALDIKKSLPPFKVRFYGVLNNIQHNLDTKLLQQYLITNILGNIMDEAGPGKNPKKLLKNLIGGGKDKDTEKANSNPEVPPATQNPVDGLKKISKDLKGLFK